MKDLTVIMPVYNEEEIVSYVLRDWVDKLDDLGIDYVIRAYNDGSKDNSLSVMRECASNSPNVEIINKPNSGHGPTILRGYLEADSKWVFHVDSDNEMKPQYFAKLWENRKKYDFLIGVREDRKQILSRKIVSMISNNTIRMFYGKGIKDVNSPYRLMRRSKFDKINKSIPNNTFAPNVIISGMSVMYNFRIFQTNVPIKFRATGNVSIKKMKLLKVAFKSWFQTVSYRINKKYEK